MRRSLATLDPELSKLRHLVAMGGGGSEIAPLPRFRFVAGDTNQTGLDGSVADPYATIGQFDAAFAATTSVNDADSPVVAFITPASAQYTENIAVPPYRQVEYRCDNLGTLLTGNVVWHNAAGAHTPAFAFAGFHNLTINGNVTCTDDAGAPNSSLFFCGDEQGLNTAELAGTVTANTTQHLEEVAFTNYVVAGVVNLGTGAANASLVGVSSEFTSPLTAFQVGLFDCAFTTGVTAITVGDSADNQMQNCLFAPGGNPVLTGAAGSVLVTDGTSWRSFLEAGGTVAAAGISVLVVGGYDGAPIQGANIGDVGATLSLNGTGAGGTWAAGGNSYSQNVALTANRVIQFLLGGGEKAGDTMLVTRTVTDANGFHITFEDDTGATLLTLASANRGSIKVRFNGTHWVLAQGFGT